jgi:hypothetical protein
MGHSKSSLPKKKKVGLVGAPPTNEYETEIITQNVFFYLNFFYHSLSSHIFTIKDFLTTCIYPTSPQC